MSQSTNIACKTFFMFLLVLVLSNPAEAVSHDYHHRAVFGAAKKLKMRVNAKQRDATTMIRSDHQIGRGRLVEIQEPVGSRERVVEFGATRKLSLRATNITKGNFRVGISLPSHSSYYAAQRDGSTSAKIKNSRSFFGASCRSVHRLLDNQSTLE